MENRNICIGVQARSTSTRFPNKISQLIGGRMVIDHVLDSCKKVARYINRYNKSNFMNCSVSVLIPKDDPIKFSLPYDDIIEGPENDVLARYVLMAEKHKATHIVRVTSDCPLIPHYVIYKCINATVKNDFDYFSNVGDLDDDMRTSIDGDDVEVLSRRALEWAHANSTGPQSEHVTTVLRHKNVPLFLKRGMLINDKDHSNIKLSIDTAEDLERIRLEYDKIQKKLKTAQDRYGEFSVHRF